MQMMWDVYPLAAGQEWQDLKKLALYKRQSYMSF